VSDPLHTPRFRRPWILRLTPIRLQFDRATTTDMVRRLIDCRVITTVIMSPPLEQGALNDDARLTSVCLTSVCRVHRA